MSRESQQLARAVGPLLKLVRQKLGVAGVVGLVTLALLYAFVVQPLVAKHYGIDPPTLADASDDAPAIRTSKKPAAGSRNPAEVGRPETAPAIEPGDLSSVLTETGRDTYRSNAGLRYTRGSQHGTRLAHLMSHTRDDPDRPGQHGVFDPGDPATVVRLVDEAYEQAHAGRNTHTQREGDQTIYEVDMGRRVGYVGGQSGNRRGRPPADHVRLVVQGDRFITAFPFRP